MPYNMASSEDPAAMRKSIPSKLKFLAITGVGQFADGYLNTTIGLVVPMLGYVYYKDNGNIIPATQQDTMKGALSIGMVCGQIFFGIFGDAFGRHNIYGRELILTMLGTLLAITAPPHTSHQGIVAWVACFRVLTGMGIGGDYPMTSSLTAEEDFGWSRPKLVLAVFSCGGVGAMAAAIVYLVLLAAFKSSVESNIYHVQWVWRLLLGLALIPCALTLYARLRIRETKPYKEFVVKEASNTGKKKRGLRAQFHDFGVYFSEWKHARTLFAVSFTWFLFDIAFYGVNLNQSVILSRIGFSGGRTPWENFHNTAIGNVIQVSAGYMPGYWLGIFLPDMIGHVRQQFLGSIVVAILYAVWAGVTNHTSTAGLIVLFTLSQFILNAGPASSTFLIPVEVFPTKVRATGHGIAAASGKLGAILTAFAFNSAEETLGLKGVLGLLSGIMAICALFTLWIPETKGLTLVEIEQDAMYGEKAVSTVSEVAGVPAISTSETLELKI